jgi:hypothetical protein
VAIACAAMPSPRPVKPSLSVVVALTLTRRRGQVQDRRDAGADAVPMRADLGRLADDRDRSMKSITPPCGGEQRRRMLEEACRGGTAPLRVAGREMHADIARADGTEQRIGDRVERDIGVAMPRKALVEWGMRTPPSHNSSPAAKRWTSKPCAVRTRKDAAWRASAAAKSAGWVIFSSIAMSPRTIVTCMPECRAPSGRRRSPHGHVGQALCASRMHRAKKERLRCLDPVKCIARETVSPIIFAVISDQRVGDRKRGDRALAAIECGQQRVDHSRAAGTGGRHRGSARGRVALERFEPIARPTPDGWRRR